MAHHASARYLRAGIPARVSAAVAITAYRDIRNQDIARKLGARCIVTKPTGRYFRAMCGVREFCVREKRFRELHRLDMPRNVAAGLCNRMAIHAGASFKQIFRNTQRLCACFSRDPVPVGTGKRLTGSAQASIGGVRIGAKQSCAVIFDQCLHDCRSVAMRNRSTGIICIEGKRMTTAAMLVHGNGFHPRAARVRHMTFGTLDDALAIGRNNAFADEVHFVIEFQV